MATSDNKITRLLAFFIGICLIVFISLYDLSRLIVKSILFASNVPAGKLTFSPRIANSTSLIVKSLAASLIGSIQTLILNSLNPPTLILPTFFTLETGPQDIFLRSLLIQDHSTRKRITIAT